MLIHPFSVYREMFVDLTQRGCSSYWLACRNYHTTTPFTGESFLFFTSKEIWNTLCMIVLVIAGNCNGVWCQPMAVSFWYYFMYMKLLISNWLLYIVWCVMCDVCKTVALGFFFSFFFFVFVNGYHRRVLAMRAVSRGHHRRVFTIRVYDDSYHKRMYL